MTGAAGSAELGSRGTVGEVVRRALAASVARLLRHEQAVRLREDPEAVHRSRVAVRRLRSDLRTFRDVLEPTWPGPLRDELAWLGRELGAVRDPDVLRARLRERETQVGPRDAAAVRRLIGGLDSARADAHQRLEEAMDSARFPALLERLAIVAEDPALLPELAGAPASGALRPAVQIRWKHLRAAVEGLGDRPSDRALHEVRIRAKYARYAAEAVSTVFGPRAEAFAVAAADLQDVLGEHHDAVVASDWLRDAAVGDGDVAFAAGRLAQIESRAAGKARDRWGAAWDALSRKGLRFWT